MEILFEKTKNIICEIIYRQHISPDRFKLYFEEILDKFVSLGKPIIIMGDFNMDLMKCETCNYSQEFLLLLQNCYFILTIDKPTRVRHISASIIDNIFVNTPDQIKVSGNIISDISDHYSQFCIFKSAKDKLKVKQTETRDFSKFLAENFVRDHSCVQWDKCLSHINVDKSFSYFYNRLNSCVKTMDNRGNKGSH